MSYCDQHQAPNQAPPMAYPPPPGQAYTAPPPPGYPVNGEVAAPYMHPVPVKTQSRGEDFWKGCVAALCCCWVVEFCCC